MMKIIIGSSIIVILLSIFAAMRLLTVSIQPDYDFFFFVQRWPGAECSGKTGCCYSTTGKPPAAFGIHGLWPEYDDQTYPTKCDPKNKNPYDPALIKDLKASLETNWPSLACPSGDSSKIWAHEWVKHGTCSLSTLTQHGYFDAALKLKAKKNLLQILVDANIKPDGNLYKLGDIQEALTKGIGYTPGIECNVDKSSKTTTQLYEVAICVDKKGSNFMDCPVYPRIKNCNKEIKFPKFGVKSSPFGIPQALADGTKQLFKGDLLPSRGNILAALKLKAKVNLLQILAKQKIKPDGNFYELGKLRDVLTDGIGFVPGIECNVDKSKNSQLYQVLICVDKSGSNFINCPVYPRIKNCNKKIKFPSFGQNLKNEL